jgi:hypothetical protein
VVEHSDGHRRQIPLGPDRPVAHVTRDVLAAVEQLAGPVHVNLSPQEVAWTTPLDQDEEHHAYDAAQVATYFAAAVRAAHVLAALRAPYRGRATPVNAWWGSFDLAVSLFSGRDVEPASDNFIARNAGDAQQVEVGWWPGDARYEKAAFYAFAAPAPDGYGTAPLEPAPGRWEPALGEYLFDWDDVIAAPDPHGAALAFLRSAVGQSCTACTWDPALAASIQGTPPPVR